MSSNYISESISLIRNLKKAANGNKLAAFSALGNVVKVTEKAAKLNDSLGESARGVIDSFTKAAENSTPLKAMGTVANVAKQGDEIGMCNSAVQIASSSSPIRALIQETAGWSAKFAAKHVMLHTVPDFIKNTKCLNEFAEKINNYSKNTKGASQVPAIISGVAYSLATIYAPKFARKVANWVADKIGIKPYEGKEKK